MSAPLDLRRSLYDSYGYRHTLVHATPMQILTRLEGLYWVWDRETGLCLVAGLGGERLSNERPADADLRAYGDAVAETRAHRLAHSVMRQASERSRAALAVLRPQAPAVAAAETPRATARAPAAGVSSLALLAAAAVACLWPVPARR
jgi:hypothetical protein